MVLFGVGPSELLREIYFETDGVLTDDWLDGQLDLPPNSTLMDIDIFAIQESLMEHGQTKNVMIERHFPDSLIITVQEHIPVMRTVFRDAQGKKRIWLVSDGGHVYEGMNYTEDTLKRLPFLIDIVLKPHGLGFKPIPGVAEVAKLLNDGRRFYPTSLC